MGHRRPKCPKNDQKSPKICLMCLRNIWMTPKHKEELSDFLYKLYNSEIFDGCMPYDMKLVWSKTLNKTAGTCHMIRKGKYRVSHGKLFFLISSDG